MALWVDTNLEHGKDSVCVKSGAHVRLLPKDISWDIVRQISIMHTQIKDISFNPECPNLTTLLLSYNKLVNISAGFFRLMPQLVVLDLSRNWSLIGLPKEFSNLGSLKYLNLSHTGIKSLPVCLSELKKLIYLNLEFTISRVSLVGIAKNLQNLQVLKLFYCHVCLDSVLMEELQHLEHLKVLTATIEDVRILEKIQGDDRLASSVQGLCLKNMSTPRVVLRTISLGGLQRLGIVASDISEIKIDWERKETREISPMEILPSISSPGFKRLSDITIIDLEGQRDLSWLLFAPNLKDLHVAYSSRIEEIINKEKGMSITEKHRDIGVPFGNLESLTLYQLAGLTEICWNYMTLPNRRKFKVKHCPNLPEDTAHADE